MDTDEEPHDQRRRRRSASWRAAVEASPRAARRARLASLRGAVAAALFCGGALVSCSGPSLQQSLACDDGGCQQRCTAAGACDLRCDGGGCQQSCAGAGTLLDCRMSCQGGGCRQDCEAGSCEVSCEGGGCTCTGFGCPGVACPSVPFIPACCPDDAPPCPAAGRSCLAQVVPEGGCCTDDHMCQPTASCWRDPASGAGVCVAHGVPVGRCCLAQHAYACTTPDGYARCAGFDLQACRALCAPADCACQAACAASAAANAGGDPSGCTPAPPSDDRCGPPPACAGQSDGTTCACDTDCATGNCQAGRCYARTAGNPCASSPECESGNCYLSCCAPSTEGSPCTDDSGCASHDCQGGAEWGCTTQVCLGTCGSSASGGACWIDAECQSSLCLSSSDGPGQCL